MGVKNCSLLLMLLSSDQLLHKIQLVCCYYVFSTFIIMSLDKMAPVTPCQVTILDRNYRYAKAFNILCIIVDIQIIELTEKLAHPKAPYWVYG